MSLAERFPRVKELAAYLRLWRKWLILLWQCLQRPREVKGEFEELLGNKGGSGTVLQVQAQEVKRWNFLRAFQCICAEFSSGPGASWGPSIATVILDNILHLQDITALRAT